MKFSLVALLIALCFLVAGSQAQSVSFQLVFPAPYNLALYNDFNSYITYLGSNTYNITVPANSFSLSFSNVKSVSCDCGLDPSWTQLVAMIGSFSISQTSSSFNLAYTCQAYNCRNTPVVKANSACNAGVPCNVYNACDNNDAITFYFY
eukprot:TRINITY_DN8270_c0_g1_i1.p1 TRINITY_DN8270_c0_g1~~TRINITY_DN8270_c0_g1_i1.p1  ORF type:complete len:166 (-),score=8.36 TRINITY_DN8270_c0_g1_i1:50-496(-)